MAYDDGFVAGLEWMWGDGFLSPGGPEELAAILVADDVRGTAVLDIGCGVGGVDVLLASRHGASRVVGIDVEARLVERAREAVQRAALADRVEVRCVEPGPLPFDDRVFDVVFTKDSLIHVEDKLALYREALRVLRPGGAFVGSDWLRGDAEYSDLMRRWLEVVHLDFELKTAAQTEALLRDAGFEEVVTRDRNAWYRETVREEIARVSGDRQSELAARVGPEVARHRLESNLARAKVVESGELRPTHFRGVRPRAAVPGEAGRTP